MSIKHASGWNFTRLRNSVVESDLGPYEKLAYAVLSYYADNSGECFPSYKAIADKMGSSKRTAMRAVESLVKNGWLEKKYRYLESGDMTSNGYVLIDRVVTESNDPGARESRPVVHESHPNESHINESQLTNSESVEILDYLNEVAGKNYRPLERNTRNIFARLKEGFTADELKRVIDFKAGEWKGTNMDQYLRPQTLFSGKFESYLNASPTKKNYYDDLPYAPSVDPVEAKRKLMHEEHDEL